MVQTKFINYVQTLQSTMSDTTGTAPPAALTFSKANAGVDSAATSINVEGSDVIQAEVI